MEKRKLKLDELNRPSVEEFKSQDKLPIVIILDDIRSAHNVGSVFRSADAFGVAKIYLCGITAQPPHKEIRKTALGATQSVEWEYNQIITDCVESLKNQGYKVYSIEQTENSQDLSQFEFNRKDKVAIVLGNEVNGVNQNIINISDDVLEVPQVGTKHSLNISVCTGVLLWEYFRQIK